MLKLPGCSWIPCKTMSVFFRPFAPSRIPCFWVRNARQKHTDNFSIHRRRLLLYDASVASTLLAIVLLPPLCMKTYV
uniref:Secreted protein n=1 Tax=Steinernema glaseri TaxID=37863 RepID=A0A1I7ZED4_9BILA